VPLGTVLSVHVPSETKGRIVVFGVMLVPGQKVGDHVSHHPSDVCYRHGREKAQWSLLWPPHEGMLTGLEQLLDSYCLPHLGKHSQKRP
jgi:hypothetical protein